MRQSGYVIISVILLLLTWVNLGNGRGVDDLPEFPQSTQPDHRQILFLNTYPIGLPIPDSIDRGILSAIQEGGASIGDLFIEHLDLSRKPGDEYRLMVAEILRRKLAGKHIGVVITEGTPALNFLTNEARDLFPDAALLTLITPDINSALDMSSKVIDIPWQVDPAGTLDLALDLFPNTKRVVVVTGTNDKILPFLAQAKEAFLPWQDLLEFEYTNEMTYEQMMYRVSSLPKNTIVLYSPYFSDTTGRSFVPAEVVIKICQSANAPVFATLEAYLGHGIIGGALLRTESIGKLAGKVALDYLHGRLKLEKPVTTFNSTMLKMFDWNELKRWKANISALPKDGIIINRPPSLYRQYKGTIIAAGVAFLGLSILILLLWNLNRRLKRLMLAATDSEARFRVMMEYAPEAILVYDVEHREIIDANPRATLLFGCSMQTLLQKDLTRFYQTDKESDDARSYDDYHAQAMAGGEVIFECPIRTYDQRNTQCEIRLVRLPFREQQLLRASFIDITERKRAEEERVKLQAQLQQAHRLEAIGQLAGGVAHDFNNMLAVIIGYTELVMEQVDRDQSIYNDLAEIKSAAIRSADITRQLLAFARKQSVAPAVIDLNSTLESLLKMLKRLIGEDVELSWRPGKKLWTINMDPTQLDQILANLCVNARGAISGVGKIIVETENVSVDDLFCSTHSEFIPGEYVRLSVSDNGCGMNKETMNRIFEPFFTTKELGKGTGLGLSTVYGAVKQNNGFINVYSEPGQGTTFAIYLPRYQGVIQHKQTETQRDAVLAGTETILLVEDQANLLAMTRKMLQQLGYKVLAAQGSFEAIQMVNELPEAVDLLITDVIMPEMSGKDLVDRLLTDNPELRYIFISGYTADILSPQGIFDDRVCFIQKPFSKIDLATKVRETLSREKGQLVMSNHISV